MLNHFWALTARRCVDNLDPSDLTLNLNGIVRGVQAVILHPDQDVAMVVASSAMPINGQTSGFFTALHAGTDADVNGQILDCWGFGDNSYPQGGFGTLRRADLEVGNVNWPYLILHPNATGQILYHDDGATCLALSLTRRDLVNQGRIGARAWIRRVDDGVHRRYAGAHEPIAVPLARRRVRVRPRLRQPSGARRTTRRPRDVERDGLRCAGPLGLADAVLAAVENHGDILYAVLDPSGKEPVLRAVRLPAVSGKTPDQRPSMVTEPLEATKVEVQTGDLELLRYDALGTPGIATRKAGHILDAFAIHGYLGGTFARFVVRDADIDVGYEDLSLGSIGGTESRFIGVARAPQQRHRPRTCWPADRDVRPGPVRARPPTSPRCPLLTALRSRRDRR